MRARPTRRWALLLAATALAAGPLVGAQAASALGNSLANSLANTLANTSCDGGQPSVVVTTVDAQGVRSDPGTVTCTSLYANATTGSPKGPYTQYTAHDIANGLSGSSQGTAAAYLTLAQVVQLADGGTPLPSTALVQLPGGNGSTSVLGAGDLDNASAFTDGELPIVELSSNTLQYVRAQRAGDSSDANGDEQYQVEDGALDLTVFLAGTALHPTVVPPSSPLSAGAPATFHVTPVKAAYSYSWDFGDGRSGTGAAPVHKYVTNGNYGVTVTVSDAADNAYGKSDVAIVPVGKKSAPSDGPPPGHGTGSPSNPPTGPDTGSGHGGTQQTKDPHTGAGSAGPSTANATDPTQTSGTPTAPAGPTGPAVAPSSGTANPSDAPAGSATSTRTAPPLRSRSGTLVDGTVIYAAHAVPAPSADAAARRAGSAQASRRPGSTPFDAKLLWWLTIPVLLGAGASAERRRPRRRASRR